MFTLSRPRPSSAEGGILRSRVAQAQISGIAAYLPEARRTSREVEALVAQRGPFRRVPPGVVEAMTGIRERRYVADDVNCSDLAAGAAQRVLANTLTPPADVDLLIFASAGQDLTEPATANIVQSKIGANCPVFDVKNACNSFLNGVQVAEAFIASGQYRRILVTTGETSSRCIKWGTDNRDDFRLSFPGYTLGDAGAAALLEPSRDGETGIYYRAFVTASEFWDIATIEGGGSRHPRGDEFTYIRGDGTALKDAFARVGPGIVNRALAETATTIDDYTRVLVHQVSMPYLRAFLSATVIPESKVEITLPTLGNMASASLPVGFAQAEARGDINHGDRVMWIGLAGGISLAVMLMQY